MVLRRTARQMEYTPPSLEREWARADLRQTDLVEEIRNGSLQDEEEEVEAVVHEDREAGSAQK